MTEQNEKPDRDLQIRGEMKFEIEFREDTDGKFIHTIACNTDETTMMVMYATMAKRIEDSLAVNRQQKNKRNKLSATQIRDYVALQKLCEETALGLASKVYRKGIMESAKQEEQAKPEILVVPAMSNVKLKRVN